MAEKTVNCRNCRRNITTTTAANIIATTVATVAAVAIVSSTVILCDCENVYERTYVEMGGWVVVCVCVNKRVFHFEFWLFISITWFHYNESKERTVHNFTEEREKKHFTRHNIQINKHHLKSAICIVNLLCK